MVFGDSDGGMHTSVASYFSNTAKLEPAFIVSPASVDHLSAVIKVLVGAGEKFAVSNGGHSPVAGSNGIKNGDTVDLSRVRWKHVYEAPQDHGRVVVGGREGDTGVAGFLLGGGNTWFTAQRGFGCDNVVSYELMLADGQIITVKQDGEHGDLFRALKADPTIVASLYLGGTTLSSKEYIPDALGAVAEFTTNLPQNPHSSLIAAVNYIPQIKHIGAGAAMVETHGVKNAASFEKWMKMPRLVDTTGKKSILAMGLDTALPYDFDTWFTLTIKNDIRIMQTAVEVHESLVNDLKAFIPDGDFVTQCLFQPLPTTFAQRSLEQGGNVMGLERNKSDGLLFQLNAMVKTVQQHEFAHPKVKSGTQAIKEFAAIIEGGLLDWIYLNYADGSQDPLGSYGAENVKFMNDVAARYDPKKVFQVLCPGGFKLADQTA
ncbi:hypothetical protein LQW54_006396 [Pestalotiopsis sp. IQ-011]